MDTLSTLVSGSSRLATWAQRATGGGQKLRMNTRFEELDAVFQTGDVPRLLKKQCETLLRKVIEHRLTTGYANELTLVSCIAAVAKQEGLAIEEERLCQQLGVDPVKMKKNVLRIEAAVNELTDRDLLANCFHRVSLSMNFNEKMHRIGWAVTERAFAKVQTQEVTASAAAVVAAAVFLITRYSRTYRTILLSKLTSCLKVKTKEVQTLYNKIKPKTYELLLNLIPKEIILYQF